MQEFTTDEVTFTQSDPGCPELSYNTYSTLNNPIISGLYYRLLFTITMCNDYLKQTTDERLNDRGVDDALRANIQYYRSETRFLRALMYYHAMDMFGNTPFITENDPIGTYLPPQRSRAELYSFIESELLELSDDPHMTEPRQNEYGRADKAAVWMLLSRLYLNAEVYIQTPKYDECMKYAADRGVTVIPEIDLPGHMLAALTAYPELGCTGGPYEVWGRWGVADDVLCPGREKTFEFLEGVLTEVMELFPSEYIHIGGDECPKVRWEKCPRCQAKIRQLGLKDDGEHTAEHYLQSYVTDRIGKFLAQHGRRIIGWDEILEGRAPSDAVVMSWRGSEGGIAAAKLGHDVIMTPNSHFYFDYYQSLDTDAEPFGIGGYIPMEQVYSYDPAFPELTPEQQKHILGVQANLWTEYVLSDEHLEYMLLPRLAALSEVQWCQPETKDWNRFIGSFRMDEIYSQMGYEFAKHIFGVTASYAVDPEKGGVVMTLTTQGGAPIRYTLDGSDPTASSPLYKAPVTIGESCTFKAAALREGMQTPVYTRKFDFNKATGRRIALNAAPTLKYTYGGASLLVDGYRGGPVYSNGAWIGFLNEPLDVTIDMQGAKPYSAVIVESLVEKGEWVFPPSSVGVYLSDDGSEFTEAALMSVPQETAGSPDGVKPFKVLFPETSARYLRVVARTVDPIPAWHGAAGQKAHMFVDEIIVE